MIKGNIFKIKEGKKDIWRDWCILIDGEYRKEAISTLIEEGIEREVFLFYEVDGIFYTIGFSDSGNDTLPPNFDKEINRLHREKKKECLEYVGPISTLYDLKS